MTSRTGDPRESTIAQGDAPGGPSWGLVGEKSYMAGLMGAAYMAGLMAAEAYLTGPTGAAAIRVDDVYGWCGLCYHFTEFPHVCPGRDRPADEEAA